MDINDILAELGLDLTNPDVREGAAAAIDAILQSRMTSGLGGAAGASDGFGGGSDTEVELDPDLLLPSQKNEPTDSDADIEIEDEEHILDQIKHNTSEDDEFEDNTNSTSDDSEDSSASNSESSSGSSKNTMQTNNTSNQESDNSSDSHAGEKDYGEIGDSKEFDDEISDKDGLKDLDKKIKNSEKNEDSVDDANYAADDDSDEIDDLDEFDDDDDEISGEFSNAESEDFDEEDLLDDELKGTFDDKDQKLSQRSRSIKRERTIAAAKKALEAAKTKKAPPKLIYDLELALHELEALTEAIKTKNLHDLSDAEFNSLVNRVFDAIEALGDSGLTYTTDDERTLQAQEIKTDLTSAKTQRELSAEDAEKIRAENSATKARDQEISKYRQRSAGSFKGFQEFLTSLYRAIALQVSTEETQDDSWSAINRRYANAGVLQPGKKIQELPNKKIPVIDFYFDQSGSWSSRDIAVGQKAVAQLADMEAKGQLKVNIYYFADHVHSEASAARAEGGTAAWDDIVKNVISTQANNVVIMTDSDMEYRYGNDAPLAYTVPGYVWYLWRDGINAPRLPRDLKGRGGTQQFAFSSSDL